VIEERAQVCGKCEWRWTCAAWDCARCGALGLNRDGRPRLVLSEGFLADPLAKCPRGHWRGEERPEEIIRRIREKEGAMPAGKRDAGGEGGTGFQPVEHGPDGRAAKGRRTDKRRCRSCREKMLKKMKDQVAADGAAAAKGDSGRHVVEGAVYDDADPCVPLGLPEPPELGTYLPDPQAAPPLKIACVITACNEGPEVERTVRSLLGSIIGRQHTVRAVVVDDGSTDESCSGIREKDSGERQVQVIRHDPALGVGRARNAGAYAGLRWGADVITFHDGHMRFPNGVIEALALKAHETGAITFSKAKGWWYPPDHPEVRDGKAKPGQPRSFVAWGSDIHWNRKDLVQPKYRIYKSGESPWPRIPCPMGACYVFARETVARLTAPTGRLWEDVAGRWGFSEQALAIKAFLLGVPVLLGRDLPTMHKYRSANPVQGAGSENMRNAAFALAALLSPQTFDLRFRDACRAHVGEKGLAALVRRARGGGHELPWSPQDEREMFLRLFGRGATVSEPHLCHRWLDALDLSEGNIAGLPRPPRVLQWRPGESTLLIRRLFPEARITCLEWSEHRAQNWAPTLKQLGARLVRLPLEHWSNPVRGGFLKGGEQEFDLITVGGEFPERCREAADSLLARNGVILVNPTGDRILIEDAERRREDGQIKKFEEVTTSAPEASADAAQAPTPGGKIIDLPANGPKRRKPTCTALLLNWKRPDTFGRVIDSVGRQTVRPRVWIWDNGATPTSPGLVFFDKSAADSRPMESHPFVDRVVRPGENMGCWPRWLLASMCDSEYVCTCDDDLYLADERVLEDAIEAHRTLCPDGIVGVFGWRRREGGRPLGEGGYKGGRHTNGADEDVRVDLVKGRFMVLRREQLAAVPLLHPALVGREEMLIRCDDIYVNLCISEGRPGAHLVPGVLGKHGRRLRENCKQDERALASNPGHYTERGEMIRLLLDYYVPAPQTAG